MKKVYFFFIYLTFMKINMELSFKAEEDYCIKLGGRENHFAIYGLKLKLIVATM